MSAFGINCNKPFSAPHISAEGARIYAFGISSPLKLFPISLPVTLKTLYFDGLNEAKSLACKIMIKDKNLAFQSLIMPSTLI